ncbi:MAG: hypothetical protein PHQ52_05780 [Candidatus Omnitrophica bacterium]|nr:hypothetical protein [Candidatus Omnitrophota bacterium]
MKHFSKKIVLFAFLVCVLLSFFSSNSYSDVKLKFIVMNPSERENQKIPIQYYLPNEIKYEDVIDAGELEVDYDITERQHFVKGEVELGPKETKVFSISVRDVWVIPDKKLDLISEYVQDKAQEYQDSPHYKTVSAMKDNIIRRVEDVKLSQEADQTITKRVDAFRTNTKMLKRIENDILVMESIAGGEPIPSEKTITLVVEVENPKSAGGIFPIKHFLPPELDIGDVIDSAGLDVNYDVTNETVRLDGEVELKGNESRKFEIKVKDVWLVDERALEGLQKEKNKILEQLVDTEFESLANYISAEMEELISVIRENQKQELPFKMRIANYKENSEKFDEAKDYLDRLRNFMLQFELARAGQEGVPDRSQLAKDVNMGGGQGQGKGAGVGQQSSDGAGLGKAKGSETQQRGGGLKGIRGLKGIILVSKSIFKGWKPEVATTWIIILAIVAFLFVFALLFYLISFMLSAIQKKEKLTFGEDEDED